MDRQISVPIKKEDAVSLRAGDYVTLTGTIYTARDAAHKRMQETLDAGEALPIEMQGNGIYYMDRPRQERDALSDLRDQQRRAVWISTRRSF